MSRDVFVSGVGMIPFTKPGVGEPYQQMAARATRQALADAGIGYDLVQQAYVGYVYGDSTAGQSALYEVGMSGIPIVNVNNNCSTGSTALFLARQAVASGAADCVLALGFEQMSRGPWAPYSRTGPAPLTVSTRQPRSWSGMARFRWRCAISAARAWPTCSSTAQSCPPLQRFAPRPVAMLRTIRWPCSAPWSPKKRC